MVFLGEFHFDLVDQMVAMVNLRAERMMWALLSAVFALTFLGERPNLRGWGGISMIVSGVLLLVFRR